MLDNRLHIDAGYKNDKNIVITKAYKEQYFQLGVEAMRSAFFTKVQETLGDDDPEVVATMKTVLDSCTPKFEE